MLKNLVNIGEGSRTYIIAAVIVIAVAVEKLAGIDVPGIEITDDWLTTLLTGLGLGTLRAAFGPK